MLPGPLFAVELVTTARRRRYFGLRIAYPVLLLLVLWGAYESASNRRYGSAYAQTSIHEAARVASHCFSSFSWVQLLALMVVAPAIAVGVISTERERRTIEYLFVSDLTNAEIVIGKTLARLLLIGKLLAVGLPIIMLLRLLGGVPITLVAASTLIVAATSLSFVSISVCVSVGSARARDATLRVYLVLVALFLLPLFLWSLTLGGGGFLTGWAHWALDWLVAVNPIHALGASMSDLGGSKDSAAVMRRVGNFFAWHVGASVVGLAFATLFIRRVHLRDGSRGAGAREKKFSVFSRKIRRRRELGDRPVLWREAYAGGARSRLGWAGAVALGLIVLSIVGTTGYFFLQASFASRGFQRNHYFDFLMVMIPLVGAATLLLLALRASGLATQEKERDTWLSLISTPLTASQLVREKLLGNMAAARGSALLLALIGATGMVFDASFVFPLAVQLALFALIAWNVSCVGLCYSLASGTTLRAMGLTLGTVLMVGGGYLFCCCPLLVGVSGPGTDALLVGLAPCVPFLLSFPSVVFNHEIGGGREEEAFRLAFVFGVLGYAVVGGVLYHLAVSRFDDWSGRTTEQEELKSRTPAPATFR